MIERKFPIFIKITLFVYILCRLPLSIGAQQEFASVIPPPTHPLETYTYKQTPQGMLQLRVHFPPDWSPNVRRPAVVFFYGGGWINGTTEQFQYQAAYYANRGMIAARADYRVQMRHGTKIGECVEDAKSAVRWLREHADTLGIDVGYIAAAGGSSGAHIAACAAMTTGYEAPEENLEISSRPDLLLLLNPILSLMEPRFLPLCGSPKAAQNLSPLEQVNAQCPPTLLLYGSEDDLLPQAYAMKNRLHDFNAPSLLGLAKGGRHGFFNEPLWRDQTLQVCDAFLAEQGWPAFPAPPLTIRNAPVSKITAYTLGEFNQPAHKKGVFKARFLEHNPMSRTGELNARFRFRQGLGSMNVSYHDYTYDIGEESFEVLVPESYTRETPYGLLVHISPGDNGSGLQVWPDLATLLERRKLIWIGANRSGNDHNVLIRRVPLALDAAYNMMKHYNIDTQRVYVEGISGGGRSASMTAFHHADLWTGGIFIIGVNYWEDMIVPGTTNRYWRSSFNKPKEPYLKLAAQNGHYVFLTGDTDGNQQQTKAYYETYSKFLRHTQYIQVPGMGHRPPPIEWLDKALEFLDAKK